METRSLLHFFYKVPPDSYPVSAVAFYGYLSRSSARNLSPHHTIVYDTVEAMDTIKGTGYLLLPSLEYTPSISLCVWFPVQKLHGPVLKLLSMGTLLDQSLKNLRRVDIIITVAARLSYQKFRLETTFSLELMKISEDQFIANHVEEPHFLGGCCSDRDNIMYIFFQLKND